MNLLETDKWFQSTYKLQSILLIFYRNKIKWFYFYRFIIVIS